MRNHRLLGLGRRALRAAAPLLGLAAMVGAWDLALLAAPGSLLPRPHEVLAALGEMAATGELLAHVVASVFRVTWGFATAALLAVPVGVALGLAPRAEAAAGPLFELLRPISPLAWIPLAILWLGVGDLAAIAIIFLASFLPLVLATKNAVRTMPAVHLVAGRNFGLSGAALVRRVVLPAVLPSLVVGLRLALGIAWLVVVAAEMIAVTSGLGFLIVDARNAGNRYDVVVAGMVMIGLIGVVLDLGMRRLEGSLARTRGGEAEGAPA
jgi:NitT/TauT family transport system permease protein